MVDTYSGKEASSVSLPDWPPVSQLHLPLATGTSEASAPAHSEVPWRSLSFVSSSKLLVPTFNCAHVVNLQFPLDPACPTGMDIQCPESTQSLHLEVHSSGSCLVLMADSCTSS